MILYFVLMYYFSIKTNYNLFYYADIFFISDLFNGREGRWLGRSVGFDKVIDYFETVGGDEELGYAGAAVDIAMLVEDEVAEAVVDIFAAVLLDGL